MSADKDDHAAPLEPDSNIARIYKHLVPPGPTALVSSTHYYTLLPFVLFAATSFSLYYRG
jgi:hypothetical protein